MRMQAPSFTVTSTVLCTCNSDTRVLVQGAEADVTLPPSAETFSQSAKPDKTVQLSDKPGLPSPKAPRTRRASSQPAQRKTPKPLDFLSGRNGATDTKEDPGPAAEGLHRPAGRRDRAGTG